MNEKKGNFKELVKEKGQSFLSGCEKHKELILVFGPILASGIIELLKINTKKSIVKEEKRLKDRCFYDPKHRHYCESIRKLTQREILSLDDRMDKGETLSRILQDMGLLK